ncbi:TerB N-terminal domain-containing protein [Companilactobacillus mishanensis]|uniref:TerB N-terminal domain-containing protein n=1 Tax=Companilactobacillus mishanensis TaxID=2486008 RepID=A0A5P0ZJ69_9LACO|nr:TerB N-terminal domain-containing protein [Companilactobacillus mishanensis]MQS45798.1 hypothetical protein [Companilactobacillus mishanensis]MQS53151.1 hypothetical protein [Companilactobacillus mishanensis]
MGFLSTIFGKDMALPAPKISNDPHAARKVRIDAHHYIIPKEVYDLLWFGDGRHKNTQEFVKEGMVAEPSIIFGKSSVIREDPTTKVEFYPSYDSLTPEQKYHYVKWLGKIDKSDDVGYAFLFLYGLERHIHAGSMVEQAVSMISRMHQKFDNESFNYYSSNTLVWAAHKYRRVEFLNGLKMDTMPPGTQIFVKLYTKGHLTPNDIMILSKELGLADQDFIKDDPELFEAKLLERLIKKYGEPNFPLSEVPGSSSETTISVRLANFSLPEAERTVEIPDMLNNKYVREPLQELLEKTNRSGRLIVI